MYLSKCFLVIDSIIIYVFLYHDFFKCFIIVGKHGNHSTGRYVRNWYWRLLNITKLCLLNGHAILMKENESTHVSYQWCICWISQWFVALTNTWRIISGVHLLWLVPPVPIGFRQEETIMEESVPLRIPGKNREGGTGQVQGTTLRGISLLTFLLQSRSHHLLSLLNNANILSICQRINPLMK